MRFDEKTIYYIVGKFLGYILMFIILSFILYFILTFFEKIPKSWSFIHILFVTFFLILVGKGIRWWLEK